MKKSLITNPVFQQLSIPLVSDQQKALETSLVRNGCREPVIIWNDMIIDGFKRYRFCTDEGIEFSVMEMEFPSEEEAVSWICRKRILQYEKKTAPFRYLVGKLYIAQKKIYHAAKKLPEEERSIKLKPEWSRVSYYVGEELGLHHATVEVFRMYAECMDQIAEKAPPLYRAILTENVIVSRKEIVEYAAMSDKKLLELCRDKWNLDDDGDSTGKIRVRRKKAESVEPVNQIPLSVGIKEMPAYDPDMELRGLMLTIPTWITAIARVEKKSGQATEKAKEQLSRTLGQLKEQIDELLGAIENG